MPGLRFKGFSDSWEQRKLSDFSKTTYGGGTPKTAVTEYWDGNIPWIQSSNLTVDDVQEVNLDKFITDDAIKNSAAKLIPANSIAIVTRVGVGKLTLMKQEFATSQDFLSLSELHVDEQFGLYSIYKLLQKELNNIQGTSIKGMTKADLLTKDIMIPVEKDEQIKIGSFFKQLDHLITLHQRKLAKLKELKKGYLQKLFPQNGEKVPELRFKEYSDAWEKRKFKDLVVRVNKTSDDSTIPSVEFEDIISKQGRLNKDVRLKINSKQGIYFEPQDVLFGKLRPYLQNWLFPSFYGRAVGDFWVLRANSSVLSEYLFVLIQSPRFQIVANISSGTKMPRSDWNTVSNTSFPIPVQSEQRKIWQLFNVLDNLIAATQHKVDLLNKLKQGYLQRMFC